MNRRTHTMTDQQLDELLAHAHKHEWAGPDHSPKVDQYLKGLTMKPQPSRFLSHSALILLGVGALTGGSLAAAVTHTIMSRHAVIVTQDGTLYDIELLETPNGASGNFIADDGTAFDIDVVDQDEMQHVTVDINSPNGGISTVILDNSKASVLTEPGQTARIEINQVDVEKPSESDG